MDIEPGKFTVRGTLIEVLEPRPYEMMAGGEKRAGISRKAQLKFGRPVVELSLTEEAHAKLAKVPQYSDVDCLCELGLNRDTNGLRVSLLDVRQADVRIVEKAA